MPGNQLLRASFPPLHVHLCGLLHPLFMLASDKANQALQAVDSLSISDEVVQQLNSKSVLPDTSVYLYQGPELVQALQERGVTRTDELFQVQRLDDRFSLSYVRMPKLVADSCLRESTLREKDLRTILNLQKVKTSQLDSLQKEKKSVRNRCKQLFTSKPTPLGTPSHPYMNGIRIIPMKQNNSAGSLSSTNS